MTDRRTEVLRDALTVPERVLLAYAMELVADAMACLPGFTEEDRIALASLREIAKEQT